MGEETFAWTDGRLTRAPVTGNLLVADSWLVDHGRVRGFPLHRDRFTNACATEVALKPGDVEDFMNACRALIPSDGLWFPRVECTGKLWLRLRTAPPIRSTAVVWVGPDPDPRLRPGVKGPDLDVLTALRCQAESLDADEALLRTPSGLVVEGALSAIVWWRGDTLCVPGVPTFDSVTRRLVERLAPSVVRERARIQDLSGLEVWSLSALHGIRHVNGWIGADVKAGPAVRLAAWRARLAAS
jgi:branched-subunit amino acid aminotransferase/4-amino-4-deoxychorismate lyase